MKKYKKYYSDFILCFLLFSLSSNEYFQYRFMDKSWSWRNHHISIERRKFIDRRINDRSCTGVITNKAKFNQYYKDYVHRRWCELKLVTEEEFVNIFALCQKIILKPRGSYGGKGIDVYDTDPEILSSVYRKYKKHKKHFVVEEYLNQTGILHDINPSSLNTIRITTIRGEKGVEILDGYYRCGCGNSIVDNFSSGGIIFPFDVESGEVYYGHSRDTLNIESHPISGIQVKGIQLPDYELIKETIIKIHRMSPKGINLVGWDVCVIDGKVVLIEGNSTPGYTTLYDPENCLWQKIKKYL